MVCAFACTYVSFSITNNLISGGKKRKLLFEDSSFLTFKKFSFFFFLLIFAGKILDRFLKDRNCLAFVQEKF